MTHLSRTAAAVFFAFLAAISPWGAHSAAAALSRHAFSVSYIAI